MASRFEKLNLDQLRLEGDADADRLVGTTLGQGGDGVRTYNRVMMLANQIIENPGLLLIHESELQREFATDQTKRELAGYFMPMPAPDWVCPEKLKVASQVWKDYTIASMGVLYAASLPYCYLIKNGIPALYDTGKLLEPYLSQRLYETGLMLSAVLDPGGIEIIEDREFDYESVFMDELRKQDPNGVWVRQGGELVRQDEGAAAAPVSPAAVAESVNSRLNARRRYLWGKGYVTTKKVRFLHASMRFMLLNPGVFPPPPAAPNAAKPMMHALSENTKPWDTQGLGYPVNQEDQAYTLLTFGLVIPRGLERWGVALSTEQKEAFLHLWKVIGHILGIKDELLTDDWAEAEALFDRIRQRQAGGSPDGMKLTDALIGLLDQYLPKLPGVPENSLPVELIRSQIGEEYAECLIAPERLKAARTPWRWPLYKALDLGAGAYFFIRGKAVKMLPLWGELTTGLMYDVGGGLVAAWKDAYRRQPFFVPTNPTTWERVAGADPAFLAELKDWRQKVLGLAGVALVLLVIGIFALAASIPLLVLSGKTAGLIALGIFAIDWLLFAKIARKRLNGLLETRPKPKAELCKTAA